MTNILAMNAQEKEKSNQVELFARLNLMLPIEYIYPEEDWDKESTLNRTIDLLHHRKKGQEQHRGNLTTNIMREALPNTIIIKTNERANVGLIKRGQKRPEQE